MDKIIIFTDAATSPTMHIAIGAFLFLDQQQMQSFAECSINDLYYKLRDEIIYHQYSSKKSTWSETKTVIDSLKYIHKKFNTIPNVEIYTDCQSLCDLLGKRKEKLQKNNFITRTGKVLQNADLYQELFLIAEKFKIQTFKIKGHHSKSNRMSLQEKIFDVLDKFSRKKLREITVEVNASK